MVAKSRQGAKPASNFDSTVLDAWTAGIEAPHGFRSEVPKDSDVVKRVETPQEHLYDIIKKEDDKKKQIAEEARQAQAKQISIEEERKQKKAAEAAKAKVDNDYEMPKDIDDDLKDLYGDSQASEKVEAPKHEAPKESPKVEAPKPVAPVEAPKVEAPKVEAPVEAPKPAV